MQFEEEINTLCSYKILGLNTSESPKKFVFYFPLYRNENPEADKAAEWKACKIILKTFINDLKDEKGYRMEEENFADYRHMYVEIMKDKVKPEITGLYYMSKQQFYDCLMIPLMKQLEEILKDRNFEAPKAVFNKVDGAVIKPW